MINGSALISGYFDGTLGDAEVGELQAWIMADAANARLFAKHAVLHQQIGGVLGSERALRIEQAEPGRAQVGKETRPTSEIRGASAWMSNRMATGGAASRHAGKWKMFIRSGWAAAAVLVVACGVLGWEHFAASGQATPPEEEEVSASDAPAFITGDAGAVWRDPANNLTRDLRAGKAIEIVGGYVELTFAAGAKVVVQGPATFTINSPTAMSLQSGKLAASVVGGGFVVNTPEAKVTDLGTEFGVSVHGAARTSVEVFKGRVQIEGLKSAVDHGGLPDIHTLQAGDMGAFNQDVFSINDQRRPEAFVRNLSEVMTSLDIVDLVCGGDGSTRRRGLNLDVVTGESGALKQVGREIGDDQYHRLTKLPAVDGCFLPDGGVGPSQVDSAGHVYKFPPTSKMTQGLLSAGGRPLDPYIPGLAGTVLGGTDYSESEHAALFMYSNKGITLDLKAIRAVTKGDFYAFRATVGNTYTKMMREQRTFPKASVFVLVDGEVRYKQLGFLAKKGPFTVKVPLTERDRFLTLVTTDGGDTRKDDYILWGDPALEVMLPPRNSMSHDSGK